MTLEFQVVNLELAKQLKELGVEQKSLFWWCKTFLPNGDEGEWVLREQGGSFIGGSRIISAFSVAELGEMIPMRVRDEYHKYFLKYWKVKNAHGTFWLCDGEDDCCSMGDARLTKTPISELTEADCRAKMLIYLKENKLI